jgi:cysteine-rich PDZ-binding protein
MVCEKCEKKLSRSAVPDVWKDGSHNAGAGQNGGKTLARNSYLESRSKGVGRFAPHNKVCLICRSKLSQDAAYCNQCAFAKAICAMCGVAVADLKFDKRDAESKIKKKKSADDETAEESSDQLKSSDSSDNPPKKLKKAKAGTSDDLPKKPESSDTSVVVNDAAGLALEAISMRTAQVKQSVVGAVAETRVSDRWLSAVDATSGKTYYYNT